MDGKKTHKKKDEETIEEVLEEETTDKTQEYEQKIADLEDQLKRAVADYRNLETRQREERIEFVKFANKNLIESLLPAFDTLLLADKYTEDQNLKITVKHVLDVLKQAGIEKVETVGKEYNPETMEAIDVVEGPENEVVEEAQPGFTMSGKTIRPARVKVGGKVN